MNRRPSMPSWTGRRRLAPGALDAAARRTGTGRMLHSSRRELASDALPGAARRRAGKGGAAAWRGGATVLLAAVVLAAASCATQTPLERLEQELDRYPEYSVVLQDMSDEGFGYAHQYRVVVGEAQAGSEGPVYREAVLDWLEVDSGTYDRYRSSLGMVVLSKSPDAGVDRAEHPPGYQQVGDERYGQWRDDGGGRSFWEFYGQYALLSNLIGGFGRPIYRDDWDGYRDARGRGQTYYGPGGGVYGTNGSTTRQTSPDFFRRQQARQAAQGRSFGQRVRGRMAGGVRSFGK